MRHILVLGALACLACIAVSDAQAMGALAAAGGGVSLAAPAAFAAVAALSRPRSIIQLRADASDPAAILATLRASFETFKTEHTQALASKADVVVSEKVERINASIGEMQATLDGLAIKLAAASVTGGAGDRPARTQAEIDYDKQFRAHMRRGDVNAALSLGSDSDGGYTAPIEWDRTIANKLKLVSPIRAIATVVSTTKRGWIKLLNNREVGSGWVGETAPRPQTSTPQLTPMAVPIGEIYANPAATQDLLDDSEINIENWLAEEVEFEFSRQEGIAFVSGDGVNKPKGLLADLSGHPWGAIPVVSSGAATALGATDTLVDLVHDLPSALATDARFIMNRNTTGKMRKYKDGQNNYIWQPSFAMGQPQTLMGYPLTEVPDMPNVGAAAVPVMFGDFRRGYLVVDRFGVRVLRDPYTNKPYVLFYTTKRVGGIVQDPSVLRAYKIQA